MNETEFAEALAKSQAELSLLYDNAACGYCTVARDGTLTRLNGTLLLWLGFDRHDTGIPTRIQALLEPASHHGFASLAVRLRNGAEAGSAPPNALAHAPQPAASRAVPSAFQTRLIRRDGQSLPAMLQVSMADDLLHLAIFNLTQTAQLGEALAETRIELAQARHDAMDQQARIARLAEATPEGIVSINGRHEVTYANEAARKILGCADEDLTGVGIERFIPARFRDKHRRHINRFGDGGITARTMASHMTVVGLRGDGTEFPLEAAIAQTGSGDEPGYTVFIRDISRRVFAEDALKRARERLRNLTAGLRTIREQEQRRVSRELHDDIGQRLSALRMDVSALRSLLPGEYPMLFDVTDRIDEALAQTVGAVRQLATGLRPKILDDLGLEPALESLLQETCKRSNLSFELSIGAAISINEALSVEVFRIVQEAVHNIVKHAQATQVRVALKPADAGLELTIRDDGQGMSDYDEDKEGALGLLGMRERIDSVGGTMHIHSAPGQGTLITCVLPA